MDLNGMPMEGFPLAGSSMIGMSLGLGEELIKNQESNDFCTGLTETEKEHIIMKCKDARSEKEMQKIIENSVPSGNLKDIL